MLERKIKMIDDNGNFYTHFLYEEDGNSYIEFL